MSNRNPMVSMRPPNDLDPLKKIETSGQYPQDLIPDIINGFRWPSGTWSRISRKTWPN